MLTENQKEILAIFYNHGVKHVVYDKKSRDKLWKLAKIKSSNIELSQIQQNCPALAHQIEKSFIKGTNIQSAVFSECSYAQTLANMFGLSKYSANPSNFSAEVQSILSSQNMTPRYCYQNQDIMLVQAGGHDGVDCILINASTKKFYTIEFKEPGAKTSEPDLPKYHEDGKLLVTSEFLANYPQFKKMLSEQKNLNFFKVIGNNIHDFSTKSIEVAISGNYNTTDKTADVICTEDKNGRLVMIPSDQVEKWADIEGEIRPAGRNHYNVWTPIALNNFLAQIGAKTTNQTVTIAKNRLGIRKERGGKKISGYKINSLFFVFLKDCQEQNGQLSFSLNKVRQLNPTITGKMFFKNLSYDQVKATYA